MGTPMLWSQMTVAEIRDYLKKRPTVILPIGCTEQHGYHLPTNVDILNAEEISKRVSAETGIAVLPTINYSYSGGELPGTVNVSPNIVALYTEEICLSLAAQGVRNIIILPGHGGSENMTELLAFRDMFLRKHNYLDVIIAVMNFYLMNLVADGDWHAGRAETSLMLYWAPELVHLDKIAYDSDELVDLMRKNPDAYQDIQKVVDSPHVGPRIRQRSDIMVGVMGYPEEASAELGKKLAQKSVQEIVEAIKIIEEQR
jgi:creatinine amidohydrolase